MNEFLSVEELRDLTQRARREGQVRMLTEAGIPFRQVGRRLLVSRHHTREWLAGHVLPQSREPNMSAIFR